MRRSGEAHLMRASFLFEPYSGNWMRLARFPEFRNWSLSRVELTC